MKDIKAKAERVREAISQMEKELAKNNKLYLICGLYFTPDFCEEYVHLKEIYASNFIGVALSDSFYRGIIFPKFNGELTGFMFDSGGESILSKVKISDKGLNFKKTYLKDGLVIRYQFHKEDNLWIGGYITDEKGEEGRGLSNCLLTEVPVKFFLPDDEELKKMLNLDPAFGGTGLA